MIQEHYRNTTTDPDEVPGPCPLVNNSVSSNVKSKNSLSDRNLKAMGSRNSGMSYLSIFVSFIEMSRLPSFQENQM